jgi:SWI/SNF-related matrix-associated actin-dependent regulator 1 of chromatin subfamily A
VLIFNPSHKLFIWRGAYETRHLPKEAGFIWSGAGKCWYTADKYIAYQLAKYAQNGAADELKGVRFKIQASSRKDPLLGVEAKLYPFQNAGVENIVDNFKAGRRYQMLDDEQGLGKTVQAICVANTLGFGRLLVICPASLRLNWDREIKKWHKNSPGNQVLLTGKQEIDPGKSLIASYDLAVKLKKGSDYKADLIIVDEHHYLKSPAAKRTQLVLGDGEGWPGLIKDTPALFLSGTPLPNGRPSELWNLIFRCAPDVINYMAYWPFIRRYCNFYEDSYGSVVLKGAKNRKELFIRLRGSGFMTRRLKKDVLQDLPDKRYKMVVFPTTGETARVLKKEEPFNAAEIKKHGVPVGTALPEIRREMGLAKVKQSVEYITNLLEGGEDKVVVFAHHIDVVDNLSQGLSRYNPVMIKGSTPLSQRQAYVDAFQKNPKCRVFLGNEAAEEGWTLTASRDCVLVEPEWVPGKNEQRIDRLHRIGQTRGVIVHTLVVENSLDAKILGTAADKAVDIKNVLDR